MRNFRVWRVMALAAITAGVVSGCTQAGVVWQSASSVETSVGASASASTSFDASAACSVFEDFSADANFGEKAFGASVNSGFLESAGRWLPGGGECDGPSVAAVSDDLMCTAAKVTEGLALVDRVLQDGVGDIDALFAAGATDVIIQSYTAHDAGLTDYAVRGSRWVFGSGDEARSSLIAQYFAECGATTGADGVASIYQDSALIAQMWVDASGTLYLLENVATVDANKVSKMGLVPNARFVKTFAVWLAAAEKFGTATAASTSAAN